MKVWSTTEKIKLLASQTHGLNEYPAPAVRKSLLFAPLQYNHVDRPILQLNQYSLVYKKLSYSSWQIGLMQPSELTTGLIKSLTFN
jgi:hypothetical protein